jgi:L-threonylcarbamoyladenylate synthase
MHTRIFYIGEQNTATVVDAVGSSLKSGGVCIIPTDTLYGIVAIDRFTEAVERIYKIKRRPAHMPFIRIVGCLEAVKRYTSQKVPDRLIRFWPGPLTMVFTSKSGGTVSIRYPDDAFLHSIFRAIHFDALVAPSANISGSENIIQCEDLLSTFGGKVDAIVCRKEGPVRSRPSTIIDISTSHWKILRKGEIEIDLPSEK